MTGFNTNTTNRIPARQPISSVEVFQLSDLPAPVSSVITLEDSLAYMIYDNLDLGGNQLEFGSNTWVIGVRDDLSLIEGTTTLPLIITSGSNGMKVSNIEFDQNGTGDLIEIDTTTVGESIQFNGCTFLSKPVRVIAYSSLFSMNDVTVLGGAQIIIDGAASLPSMEMSRCTFAGFFVAVAGIILIEEGASVDSIKLINPFLGDAQASIIVKLEKNVSIGALLFDDPTFGFITSAPISIQVENPNTVDIGTISKGTLSGAGIATGKIFSCAPESSSTSSITGTGIMGICQDGIGNLLISDDQADTIQRYAGLTNTTNGLAIAAPGGSIRQLAWSAGVMYSVDSGTNPGRVYFHNGYAVAGVNDFVETQDSNPSGVVFVGENMVTTDNVNQNIFVHDGFSATILDTIDISSVIGTPFGLAYDGVNLHIGDVDDQTVKVMKGVSNIVLYEFDSASANQRDLWQVLDHDLTPKEVGYAVTDLSTQEYHLYDHPVTFDHSSATWDIMDIPGITESSDRGGAEFSSTETGTAGGDSGRQVVLSGLGAWNDIAASEIKYASFSMFEKYVLSDETNGEGLWLSSRDRGLDITGHLTFNRGAGSGDPLYKISLVVDGIPIKDSVVITSLATANTILSVSTVPVSRDLVLGKEVKMQINQIDNGESQFDPFIIQSAYSVV